MPIEHMESVHSVLKGEFQIDLNEMFTVIASESPSIIVLRRVNFQSAAHHYLVRVLSKSIREASLGDSLRYDPDEMASLLVGALSITRSGANFRASFASALEQFSSEH